MAENEIKYVQVGDTQYQLVDLVARSAIEAIDHGAYIVSTNAATTPKGVTWTQGSTTITGTLEASAVSIKRSIYLVPTSNIAGKDVYDEYMIVQIDGTYTWERFGNTEIEFDNLGSLAYLNSVTLNKTNATVLKSITVEASPSLVEFSPHTTDTFVKSYPGVTHKLATTAVTGVSGSTTASKATAGTAVNVAKRATSQTTVGNANVGTGVGVMTNAVVNNEVLSFSTTTVTPATASTTKIYGCQSTDQSITPYTFADVTVPVKDTNATTVATGSLADSGTGASVLTGLGTPVTATSITALGQATAQAQELDVETTTEQVVKDVTVSIS